MTTTMPLQLSEGESLATVLEVDNVEHVRDFIKCQHKGKLLKFNKAFVIGLVKITEEDTTVRTLPERKTNAPYSVAMTLTHNETKHVTTIDGTWDIAQLTDEWGVSHSQHRGMQIPYRNGKRRLTLILGQCINHVDEHLND